MMGLIDFSLKKRFYLKVIKKNKSNFYGIKLFFMENLSVIIVNGVFF